MFRARGAEAPGRCWRRVLLVCHSTARGVAAVGPEKTAEALALCRGKKMRGLPGADAGCP